MPRREPFIYGPAPPDRDDMVWIVMERQKKVEKKASSENLEMRSKTGSSVSLNHEQKNKTSFAQAIMSSIETQEVLPNNDGSKFKIISCYDNQTNTMTIWNHTSVSKPKKYISQLTRTTTKTTSCPSLSTLLSEAASSVLAGKN